MNFWKRQIRKTFLAIINLFASDIYDSQTGAKLGRFLIVSWRGKIFLFGDKIPAVVPEFLPQKNLTYWKREMGFMAYAKPDFPSIALTQTKGRQSTEAAE